MQPVEQSSVSDPPYARILKSTTIIGGSSAVNMVFRILQAKAAAVLIGPAGVGLMGLFNAALGLAGTLAGMGLSTSGVRQIAEAAGSSDEARIARTVIAFRRLALFFGLLGALLFWALRQPIARLTFGDDARAGALGWLSIALLLLTVSAAQSAYIRGMQRVGDLARVSVLGIAIGTLAGIPLLYFFGEQGIVPYLVFSALTTLAVSWWYSRKIPLAKARVAWRDVFSGDGRALLSLGVVFMVTGLTTMAATYLVKVVVTRQLGLESAGLYEAASQLSNVYIGFILAAMGADFFPHLASVSRDRAHSAQLVNTQVEVGLLIAAPGILAVLALGSFLLQLLYSAQFAPAFEIVRWQALGTFLRVVSWPLAMVTMAKGKGKIYFGAELAVNLFYLGCIALFVPRWGLTGIGPAFFAMYVFYVVMTSLVARHLIGFRWSTRNLRLAALLSPVVLAAFLASYFLPQLPSTIVGLGLAVVVGVFSLRALYRRIGPAAARAYWQRVKTRLGWSKI
ncbi:MAG: oligosaccharide flippase family protein [Anaerolineales bacterium]|nr:oligosaccharide flippase family protein [Anaerolineales bacterium]